MRLRLRLLEAVVDWLGQCASWLEVAHRLEWHSFDCEANCGIRELGRVY